MVVTRGFVVVAGVVVGVVVGVALVGVAVLGAPGGVSAPAPGATARQAVAVSARTDVRVLAVRVTDELGIGGTYLFFVGLRT